MRRRDVRPVHELAAPVLLHDAMPLPLARFQPLAVSIRRGSIRSTENTRPVIPLRVNSRHEIHLTSGMLVEEDPADSDPALKVLPQTLDHLLDVLHPRLPTKGVAVRIASLLRLPVIDVMRDLAPRKVRPAAENAEEIQNARAVREVASNAETNLRPAVVRTDRDSELNRPRSPHWATSPRFIMTVCDSRRVEN